MYLENRLSQDKGSGRYTMYLLPSPQGICRAKRGDTLCIYQTPCPEGGALPDTWALNTHRGKHRSGGAQYWFPPPPPKKKKQHKQTIWADFLWTECPGFKKLLPSDGLSVLKRCVPKTLAFAFGLRLRSKTRCFKTRVLGRRLPIMESPKRGCDLGPCVVKR